MMNRVERGKPNSMFTEKTIQIYEDLADYFSRQKDARQRDVFLVLAADAAFALGRPDHAERLRLRLLQASPHSLLKPFSSFAEARKSPDIQLFLDDLRRQYPPQEAEKILGTTPGRRTDSAKEKEADAKGYRLQGEPAAAPKPPVSPWSRTPEPKPKPAPKKDLPDQTGEEEEEEITPGSWLSALLFALTLIAALGLAVYSLLPFLFR